MADRSKNSFLVWAGQGQDIAVHISVGLCVLCSALGGTRTPNRLIRSQMLYPIEPRALNSQTECTQQLPKQIG